MLEAKKYSIIKWIITLADEKVIDTIQALRDSDDEKSSESIGGSKKEFSTSTYRDITNRKVDVEKLKVNQEVKFISSKELKQLSVEANIEQSIDELLLDLKALG